MENKERKRRRWRWLAGIGAAVLLILVGLAPLFLLVIYPRMGWQDPFSEKAGQEESSPGEESAPERYMVQDPYRYCRHGKVCSSANIPLDYPEPPQSLVEIALALQNSNLNIQKLLAEIRVPDDWHLAEINPDREQTLFLLTCLGDLCPDCADRQYLGLYQDHIAVFRGVPPEGQLVEITEIKVKEIDRELLEKGLPFDSEEQKRMYLETFTS